MARPIPRQYRYDIPGVKLHVDDLDELWTHLNDMIQAAPVGCDLVQIKKSVEAEDVTNSAYASVKQEELEGFFDEQRLPDVVKQFTLSLNATFRGKDDKGTFHTSRRVGLSLNGDKPSSITISGEPEWVPRVREYLDGFVKNHRRSVRFQAVAVSVTYWFGPVVLLILAFIKLKQSAFLLGAFGYGIVGGFVLLLVLDGKFPDSIIVVRPKGEVEPWYSRWAGEALAAIIVGLAVAVVLYLI